MVAKPKSKSKSKAKNGPRWVTVGAKGKTYDYNFWVKGTQFRASTGLEDEEDAHQFAKALREQELENWFLRRRAQGRDPTVVHDMPLKALAEEFRRNKAARDVNKTQSEAHIERIVALLGPKTMMSRIKTRTILDMVADLGDYRQKNGKPYKNGSKNEYLRMCRRMHIYARDTAQIPGMQTIDWRKQCWLRTHQRTREFTYAEEAYMFGSPREDMNIVGKFGMVTGLRLENLVKLKWSEVDFDNLTVEVTQKQSSQSTEAHPHTIRMTKWMIAALKDQVRYAAAGNGQVWTRVSTRTIFNRITKKQEARGERTPMTESAFYSWFRGRADGIPGPKHKDYISLIPHDMRRSVGGRVLSATGSMAWAQAVLGHHDIKTTQKYYAHYRTIDVMQAMETTALVTRRKIDELLQIVPISATDSMPCYAL